MNIQEEITELHTNYFDIDDINKIVDKIEEQLGAAEMWCILRTGFSNRDKGMEKFDYIDYLEYIAIKSDI